MVYLRSSFSAAKIAEWGARGKGDMPILANGGRIEYYHHGGGAGWVHPC